MKKAVLPLLAACAAAAATDQEIEKRFQSSVKPFVSAYCVSCHRGANAAAQFDLTAYATVADTVRDHARWALVAEKLHSMEMPPKGLKQPPAAERELVTRWVRDMRTNEANRNAGDPGPVLARRLNNAEYNYAIRDLTGHDLRPAREFPVDPANPDGFDNSGESLTMSPALLNKYLQAAREVANHMVMRPIGLGFAPHPMLVETDREKYTIQRIVDFYDRQPTDYAAYFQAAWRYKHRAAEGRPEATLEQIAREAKISPKYLPMVWEILETGPDGVGPVLKLRTMWRRLPAPAQAQPELIREACVKMRDYVVRIRKLTARQFRSPKVQGLAGTSQPLMNWKLRAYAAHRRDFDRAALQVEGEPPLALPVLPRMGGVPTEDQVAMRNAALAVRARFGEPDLLVPAGQRERYEESFARFANVFPDAFYIRERGRFYPDDSEDQGRLLSAGFHNVMGYFRDDTPLQELILDEDGKRELDLLWLEFDTVADFTTRTYVQFYFNQSGEVEGRGRESGSFRPPDKDVTTTEVIFGVRDQYLAKAERNGADETAKEAIRDHFARVNATIRAVEKARLDAIPTHLEAIQQWAARAWRRPLTKAERGEMTDYYKTLREKNGLSHEDATRDLAVFVLMSPDFLYRVDLAPKPVKLTSAPARSQPVSEYALASRLSFFLWSSIPDDELLARAAAGDLHKPEVLAAQVRRLLKDPRSRSLAVEFAGNWLGFRRFEDHNSVDRTRFPEFTNELRQAMFEEPVRFIDDVIRNDRSMLELLYARHTFVNRELARHYEMENVRPRPGEWVKVEDARMHGRGGILPMSVFLTKNSPGLRTSPVKRGYWVARQLFGEVIPPPPPSVPELPDDESKMNLPLREMLAKHRENAACAGCHQRFDGFGLSFEGYGPVGEKRTKDLAGRAVDTQAEFPGGGQGKGIDGLIEYIRSHREKDFVNNLCRKVLAYALGRGLLLSDEPLLDQMRASFEAGGHRLSVLIESVAGSQQFRSQRVPEPGPRKGD